MTHSTYNAPYIFGEASPFAHKGVHLGVCGSIAAFRAPDLLRWWLKSGLRVGATLTESAQKFIAPLTFEALGAAPVYTDMWDKESIFGHLEPGQCASVMVIAPATAATLAQLASGQAHTLLACQALAFSGPLLLAPAMNPKMWEHPATQENLAILQKRGVYIVAPGMGSTACKDEGQGRLADLRHIWLASLKLLAPQDMIGKKVLVTLGPTREQWDAVRYWSNPSTGRMGACLALSAWLRGAEVHAVCGPVADDCYLPTENFMHMHKVQSAKEMFTAATDLWPHMDMGIFTAAVADYSPTPPASHNNIQEKFKKSNAPQGFDIHFTPNADILENLGKNKQPHQKILGFAAESSNDLIPLALQKLVRKNADIIAANNINAANSGFATATNSMVVVGTNGREEIWPNLPKIDVAWRLCSWLLQA